jgi:hypothetical protein
MEIDGVATVVGAGEEVGAAGGEGDEPPDPQAAVNARNMTAVITPRLDLNQALVVVFCTYTLSTYFLDAKEKKYHRFYLFVRRYSS